MDSMVTAPVTDTEVRVRIVNAALVVASVAIAAAALWHIVDVIRFDATAAAGSKNTSLQTELQNVTTFATAAFGALTTFLGGALAAYFGIAAAVSGQKNVAAALTSAQQQLGSMTQQQQQPVAPASSAAVAPVTIAAGPPQDPDHGGSRTAPQGGGLGTDVTGSGG